MKQHKMSKTPTYQTWEQMNQRCRDIHCKDYKWYGARGIDVCERWLDFRNFFADMGARPTGMSIDRIDSLGNYEPSNCRWADKFQQKHNRTDNLQLTFEGRTQPAAVWAREIRMKPVTLYSRLRAGWPVERALTAPLRGAA